MPGRQKVELKIGRQVLCLLIRNGFYEPERRVRIFDSVERQSHGMLRTVMLVAEAGFLLLKMRGIRQQHSQEIDGSRCSVHNPAKALLYETRQISRVVDVGMSENDR